MTQDQREPSLQADQKREQLSQLECIAYVATMLPDLKVLAASEPELQRALEAAEAEAGKAVARHEATGLWEEAGLPAIPSP